MDVPKIEKLEELITKYIDKNKKIVSKQVTRLTEPGENFGSEILKIDLILQNDNGKEEDLNVVAKLLPENEFFRHIFNVSVSFKVETGFYNTIVPSLQDFQRKQGVKDVINFFPKFYGARNNLKEETDDVDNDAVLVLENLKTKGFKNVDRFTGFDLPTTKLILKNMAQFHAVPVALKHNDPDTFEKKIKAGLSFNFPLPPRPDIAGPIQVIYMLLEQFEIGRRLLPKVKKSAEKFGMFCNTFREPFATIGHRDFWCNNIMIKFDNLNPVDVKFLDFQMFSYDSPAADLIFFIFGNVSSGILEDNFDDLLKYYQEQFEDTLQKLNCDLKFPYETLLEEIALSTEWELFHILFMFLFVIKGPKGGIKVPEDPKAELDRWRMKFDDRNIKRVVWMLEECERRNWLNF